MKLILACLVSVVLLSIPIAAQAGPQQEAIDLSGKGSAPRSPAEVANPETAVACTVCFSCGSDWPLFEGAYANPTASTVFERGGGCFGPPAAATDTFPFLCCR